MRRETGNPCFDCGCGWYDSDLGCTCPSLEKWYQCPLEPEPDWEEIMKEEKKKPWVKRVQPVLTSSVAVTGDCVVI